jgi:5-methylcytosine-specific restriction protein A
MNNTKRPWRSTKGNFHNNKDWLSSRSRFLTVNPKCNFCGVKSTIVDHITPHKGDWVLFMNQNNWQALCKLCHDSAKQKAERRGLKRIGSDLNGFPTDPDSPWSSY